jgi:hypothetical protein
MDFHNEKINFIRHLILIDEIFENDDRFTPFHISLYFSLFMIWNKTKFKNPIIVRREEVKSKAKINSNNSYAKHMKELADFGLIVYTPSNSWVQGSTVEFIVFDSTSIKSNTTHDTSVSTSHDISQQATSIEFDTTHIPLVIPFLNKKTNKNNLNSNSKELEYTQNPKIEEIDFKKEKAIIQKMDIHTPKNVEEVEAYFLEKKNSKEEANKFFNYYEANGWLVGGRTKMKNWKAAANNWLANASKFKKPEEKRTYLHVEQNKDYSIPL